MLRQRVFRARVARRVLLLFVVSAIIPTLVVAALSLFTVTDHLDEVERDRLRRNAKAVGLAVLERLRFHATELYNLGVTTGSGLDVGLIGRGGAAFADSGRYHSVALVGAEGRRVLMGDAPDLPLTDAMRDHLDRAGAAILTLTDETGANIVMLVRVPGPRGANIVLAELNPDPLFAAGSNKAGLPPDTDVCVFDARRRPLYCSGTPVDVAVLGSSDVARSEGTSVSTWNDGAARQLTASWPLFLQSAFGTRSWTVALSEPADVVLAPTRRFRLTFPLAIALAAAVVFLMSSVQIRRVLYPIQRLHEGTARLASGDFEEQVRIETGDEFSDLAGAFNDMASRIARQLQSLEARNTIDRAVLSKLETKEVVETILARGPQALGADGVIVCVRREASGREPWELAALGPGGRYFVPVTPPPAAIQQLVDRESGSWSGEELPGFLQVPGFDVQRIHAFLVEPIRVERHVTAILVAAYSATNAPDAQDHRALQQLADQMAVALSNIKLVQDLEALNLGTLEALARAIDAKSRWTAGHATRVTALALELGRVLGLGEEDMAVLNRGGLLHDIGKIGVPAAILDKPDTLDADEERVMRSHPEMGARILAPIAAYHLAIPLVLYHHEKWNGTGYPHGLAGVKIPYLARVLAVADVWDALTSTRPYRKAFTLNAALEVIRDGAGTHFDPQIVSVVLPYLESLAVESRDTPDDAATETRQKDPTPAAARA